jgi:hypothetical protein
MSDTELFHGISDVELLVPDWYEFAGWYQEAFGFETVDKFKNWTAVGAYLLNR